MPQDVALIGELTVKEILFYFGSIYEMKFMDLCSRYQMLHKLLELPPNSKKVAECSGGQMRRISLAAAIIHDPSLLILDEPTVGLDPVLRQKIWDFMLNVVKTRSTSIIITTHYIDEAKHADCVGFMRNGILLAEDSPSEIKNRHQSDNLDEVFLNLCLKDHKNRAAADQCEAVDIKVKQNKHKHSGGSENFKLRIKIVKALILKYILQVKKRPGYVKIYIFFEILTVENLNLNFLKEFEF